MREGDDAVQGEAVKITCIKCGVERGLSDFHKNKSKKHGVNTTCRACYRVYFSVYYLHHAASRRLNTRRWEIANPDKSRDLHALYRERNKIKIRARSAVNNAIRNGSFPSISTWACMDCGLPATGYDHYAGYEKEHWFDVEPVCDLCHAKREGKRRVAAI